MDHEEADRIFFPYRTAERPVKNLIRAYNKRKARKMSLKKSIQSGEESSKDPEIHEKRKL